MNYEEYRKAILDIELQLKSVRDSERAEIRRVEDDRSKGLRMALSNYVEAKRKVNDSCDTRIHEIRFGHNEKRIELNLEHSKLVKQWRSQLDGIPSAGQHKEGGEV